MWPEGASDCGCLGPGPRRLTGARVGIPFQSVLIPLTLSGPFLSVAPPLPKMPLRVTDLVLPLLFLPRPVPPTPAVPLQLEGASECGGSGLGPQQAPQGLSGQGKHWPCSLLILRSPEGLSLSLLIPSH